jgi:hypothetical protein
MEGRLDQARAEWDPRVALGVVMAAGGYPDAYQKDHPISGLPALDAPDLKVFHAGTRLDGDRRSSPMAAGCSASPPWARRHKQPRTEPTPPSGSADPAGYGAY